MSLLSIHISGLSGSWTMDHVIEIEVRQLIIISSDEKIFLSHHNSAVDILLLNLR